MARMVKRAKKDGHSPLAKERLGPDITDTMPWSLAV